MNAPYRQGKPYYSLDAYLKNTYGEKCYKIALDGGFTCPNRDGRIGTGGCIFCSRGGSGDFATPVSAGNIRAQIEKGLALFHDKKVGNRFIAYFQAYTNTYGPIEKLRVLYTEALLTQEVIGISIATRPDCLDDEVLSLLSELKAAFPDKFIWVELGLQTIHKKSADFIKRGYDLPVYEKAAADLQRIGIPFIVHVILGLPGETPEDMIETCKYLNASPRPFGIKLQLLHILKDTDLGAMYEAGELGNYRFPELEEYTDWVSQCLSVLSPDIVIHRVTGDGPKSLLIGPTFSLNKRNVLNTLHRTMAQQNIYQGRNYHGTGSADTL